MRVWRGIFTNKSRVETLGYGFDRLPSTKKKQSEFIIDKILDNFSGDEDARKLTSFSKSKQIALRHAGNRGWLLEVEVEVKHIVEGSVFLEKARSDFSPSSPEWERFSEALGMTIEDQEVFLKAAAKFKVVDVFMVGGIERKDGDL